MNKTTLSENTRKDNLFKAWNQYLRQQAPELEEMLSKQMGSEGEIYEGNAMVYYKSKNFVGLRLDDGEKVRYLKASPEVTKYTNIFDFVYLVILKDGKKWWPLEVFSISSIFGRRNNEGHLSVNPEMMSRPFFRLEETIPQKDHLH